MKATELRIGNLIKCNKRFDYGTYVITKDSFAQIIDDEIQKEGLYEPIPLTDEWLEFLGAERNNTTYVYDRFNLLWIRGYNYWYVREKESYVFLTKIEFVHQWQNFVLAMNGVDLIIRGRGKQPTVDN